MNTETGPYSRSSARLVFTVIVSLTGVVRVASATQFTPPDLKGFALSVERDSDGDGDEVNETHIKQYLNGAGDSVVSMTTKGRLWAWSLNSKGNESPQRNYVIRDSNCDGIFDEVYGLDDEFHVPECLK